MDDIAAFIIHLDRATDRKAQVQTLIDTLPVPTRAFPAVDARTAPPEETARYQPDAPLDPAYPFPLSDTEIAVFLSYRAAWDALLKSPRRAVLILEDDVALDMTLFEPAFALARNAESGYVRLPDKNRETGKTLAVTGETRLIHPDVVGLGMQAQLVTRDAAHRLLAASETFDRPVDVFLQMTWLHGAEVLTVWPTGVTDISGTLGGSTLKKRKGLRQRLSAEVKRAIFRRRMASLARGQRASGPLAPPAPLQD